MLRAVKYGDHGVIVDLFTESRGRMSVMTYRPSEHSRKGAGRMRATYLMPLAMLDMECDIHGPSSRLPHPRSIGLRHNYLTLQSEPTKSMVALFVAEFLANALREESGNPLLFEYIEKSLLWLDAAPHAWTNFHLVLLMRMTRFMGIEPPTDFRPLHFFDLMNSEYTLRQPLHPHFLKPDEAAMLPLLLRMNFNNMHRFRLSRQQRHRILEVINMYYRLHMPGFGELRSMEVLSAL